MEDDELLKIARAILHESQYHELRKLDCRLSSGRLLLSGTVSSFHMKQLAFHALQGKVNGTPIRHHDVKVQ